jgi:endonuclease G
LNVTQYAQTASFHYAIRNNFYVQTGVSAVVTLYQTDTEPGVSGSPVCDDSWNVLALHRASIGTVPQHVPQEVINGQPVSVNV